MTSRYCLRRSRALGLPQTALLLEVRRDKRTALSRLGTFGDIHHMAFHQVLPARTSSQVPSLPGSSLSRTEFRSLYAWLSIVCPLVCLLNIFLFLYRGDFRPGRPLHPEPSVDELRPVQSHAAQQPQRGKRAAGRVGRPRPSPPRVPTSSSEHPPQPDDYQLQSRSWRKGGKQHGIPACAVIHRASTTAAGPLQQRP